MAANLQEQQLCKIMGHDNQILTQYCLNLNCKELRLCCGFCLDFHHDHLSDVLSINSIKEFIKQQPSLGSPLDQLCQQLILLQNIIVNRINEIIQSKKELEQVQAPNFMSLFNPDKSKDDHTQTVVQLRKLSNIIKHNQQWELSLKENQDHQKIKLFDMMISQQIIQSLDQYQNYIYQVHYDNNFEVYDYKQQQQITQSGNVRILNQQQQPQQSQQQQLQQQQLQQSQQQQQQQQLQQQLQQQQQQLQQQLQQQQQQQLQQQQQQLQQQIQVPSKYLFSEALQVQFKIWDDDKCLIRRLDRDSFYGQSQRGYYFALLDHSIQYYNRNVIYGFELQERDDFIRNQAAKSQTFYIGIANPKIIKAQQFKLGQFFNGCYLIGTNGISQSFDNNYSNTQTQMKFHLGDTIICQYNYQNRILTYKKLNSNLSFNVVINEDVYHPCICLDYMPYSGIFIRIMNEEEIISKKLVN